MKKIKVGSDFSGVGAIRGRNPDNPKSRKSGLETTQMLEINENGTSNCFRLMDFPETFDFSCASDSQAYKQAGNSIVVNVLIELIKKLKF